MRILVVHDAYRQTAGGADMVRAEIALLRAHGNAVFSCVGSQHEAGGDSRPGPGAAGLRPVGMAVDIDAVCRCFRPDLIHVHNVFFVVSPAIYATAAKWRIPVVQTLPESWAMPTPALGNRHGAGLPDSWHSQVSRFIAVSASARAHYIEAGLPRGRILVKPHFVEGGARRPRRVRRGGLFVGRLTAGAGADVLLEALRLCGRVEMRVAAAGPLRPVPAGRSGNAHAGMEAGDGIAAQMREAAFLVMPGIGREQMPPTVLEAYASGLPVIGDWRSACAGMVRDGVTGLLTDADSPRDLACTMRWALDHPERMAEMGRAARAEYERLYTAPANYRMLRAIYEDAILDGQAGQPAARWRSNSRVPDRPVAMGRRL